MEFERGHDFDLDPYDPCPKCGVRDIDMRDPSRLDPDGNPMPRNPPPLVAVGWQCLFCLQAAIKDKELNDAWGGKPPGGLRIVAKPYEPGRFEPPDDDLSPPEPE